MQTESIYTEKSRLKWQNLLSVFGKSQVRIIVEGIRNKNQLMSLFQFYSYIAGSLHVHNIQSTRPEQYRHWTNGCGNSCVKSPKDGPVGLKHVEIRQYMNKIKIATSVGFYSRNRKMYMSRYCSFQLRAKFLRLHLSSRCNLRNAVHAGIKWGQASCCKCICFVRSPETTFVNIR